MLKIICAAIMCFLLSCSTVSPAVAAENLGDLADIQIDYSSAKDNPNGSTTYNVINADEIAAYYGIDDPKSITVTVFNDNRSEMMSPGSVNSINSLSITNLTGPFESCGSSIIAMGGATNHFEKPVVKTITLTGNVANQYSVSGSGVTDLDVAKISAAVGFDVTASWSLSDATQVELEPGESVTVYAYPFYLITRFDIVNDPWFGAPEVVGKGAAYECKGFCTVVK